MRAAGLVLRLRAGHLAETVATAGLPRCAYGARLLEAPSRLDMVSTTLADEAALLASSRIAWRRNRRPLGNWKAAPLLGRAHPHQHRVRDGAALEAIAMIVGLPFLAVHQVP